MLLSKSTTISSSLEINDGFGNFSFKADLAEFVLGEQTSGLHLVSRRSITRNWFSHLPRKKVNVPISHNVYYFKATTCRIYVLLCPPSRGHQNQRGPHPAQGGVKFTRLSHACQTLTQLIAHKLY